MQDYSINKLENISNLNKIGQIFKYIGNMNSWRLVLKKYTRNDILKYNISNSWNIISMIEPQVKIEIEKVYF